MKTSPITITTHVLDTAIGKPAMGIPVVLSQWQEGKFVDLALGMTNHDGRVSDLLASDTILSKGTYRMHFELEGYFQVHQTESFYPYAEVVFKISDEGHYHIPLLLSPYGYSTYRGS